MSNELNPLRDRLEELLVGKVTEGWGDAEAKEFEQTDWSVVEVSPSQQLEELERAAAAFDVLFDSTNPQQEALPAQLRDKILANAKSTLAGTQKIDAETLRRESEKRQSESSTQVVYKSSPIQFWRESFAWVALAASGLFILLNFAPTPSPPTPQQAMAMLIESAPSDLVEPNWQPMASQTTKGKVVWSDEKQEGYMVFEGLAANDPLKKQYQLWIFDTDANQEYPIDGGVFDIPADGGNSVIPINAKIPVDKAVMFAVTEEIPGGVVVSKREVIPVLAIPEEKKE